MLPVSATMARSAGEVVAGQQNSVEGFAAIAAANLKRRVSTTLLQNLSAEDVFQFLVSEIPALRSFESLWTFSGADLVSIEPKSFIRTLRTEYQSFPFSVGVEVYKLVQQKILSDVSMSEGQPSNLSTDVVQSWSDAPVPSFQQAFLATPEFGTQFIPSVAAHPNPFQFFANFPNQNQHAVNFSNQIRDSANSLNQSQGVSNIANSSPIVPTVLNNMFSAPIQSVPNVSMLGSAIPNQVNGVSSVANVPNIPLQVLTAVDVCSSLAAACKSLTGDKRDCRWPAITIDGNFILQSTPSRFINKLIAEVPELSEAQKIAAAIWAQAQIIAQAQRDQFSIDSDTLRIWVSMPRGFPMIQTVNEGSVFLNPNPAPSPFPFSNSLQTNSVGGGVKVKNSKFIIGGPRLPFQNSNVANVVNPFVQAFQQFPALTTNLAAHQAQSYSKDYQMAASAGQVRATATPL
jgi:hypothetical protein